MQRTAIARAIAINPKLILADEPTGNLDSQTGKDILNILKKLHADGTTIMMVTHDMKVASHAQKTIQIQDGKTIVVAPTDAAVGEMQIPMQPWDER